ncbi:hypothetical protein FOMPIDRAFT_83059 [Fomitopsis schrenkii]|uniref:Uncharacterized protein n=1 Tax=Fomitopsis schrenkii TaxID=2126942 RepID=S8DX08_FOMSC|nr:hypothetical protein FOMPIDRAFT_83059 [Fomitopsis schrenkii]
MLPIAIEITVTVSTEVHEICDSPVTPYPNHCQRRYRTDGMSPAQPDCVSSAPALQSFSTSNKRKSCDSPSPNPKRPRVHIATQTLSPLHAASRDSASTAPSSPSSFSSSKSASSLFLGLSRKPSIWLQKMIH